MRLNLQSLVVRIVFFGLATIFLSLLIFSSVFIFNQRKELSRQIVDKGRIYSEFSARSFYNDYVSFYTQFSENNFLIFRLRGEEKMALNEDIINVSLLSVNGRILFDSDEFKNERYSGDFRSLEDESVRELLRDSNGASRELKKNGSSLVEFYVPIKEISGDHVLVMKYTLSLDSFDERMAIIYRQTVFSFILVFILVLILSIPLYLSITKPLKKLSALTQKVRGGDLDVKIDSGLAKDEIGALAGDFNSMIDELRLARDKSADDSKKLEKELELKSEELKLEKEKVNQDLETYKKELETLKVKNHDLEKLNQFMVDREIKMVELKKRLEKEEA